MIFVKNKFVKNRVGGREVNLNLDNVFKYTVFFGDYPLETMLVSDVSRPYFQKIIFDDVKYDIIYDTVCDMICDMIGDMICDIEYVMIGDILYNMIDEE